MKLTLESLDKINDLVAKVHKAEDWLNTKTYRISGMELRKIVSGDQYDGYRLHIGEEYIQPIEGIIQNYLDGLKAELKDLGFEED